MDKGNFSVDIKQEQGKQSDFNSLVTEDGRQYHVPYKIVKKVTFSNLRKEELIDIPHAARLQYRLMLLDPIIKARVDFTKQRIIVIYNPRTADNIKEKISLDELIQILAKEGVHAEPAHTEDSDYDYYHEFYSYAYNPSRIRERPPYGYSADEWKNMKAEYESKMAVADVEKRAKFKAFQDGYLGSHPEMAEKIVPGYKPPIEAKQSFFAKLFSKKKKQEKEKGFWFHGV